MAQIFISHSSTDDEFVKKLQYDLRQRGLSAWVDHQHIRPGVDWRRTVEENLRACEALIVVMTSNAEQSTWVQRELLEAEKINKPIIPLLLEGEVWPQLKKRDYLDCRNIDFTESSEGLIRSIEAELRDANSLSADSLVQEQNPQESLIIVDEIYQLARLRERFLLWNAAAIVIGTLAVFLLIYFPPLADNMLWRILSLIIGASSFLGILLYYYRHRIQLERETTKQVYTQNQSFFKRLEEELDMT